MVVDVTGRVVNMIHPAEEAEKVYKSGQAEILEKATSRLPKEMKERLFSAIESTAGNNISFSEGEKKLSIYSVIADCLNQTSSVSAEDPTGSMDNSFSGHFEEVEKKAEKEGKELLDNAYAMTDMID